MARMPDVIDALRLRRARRAFASRPVPADVLECLWTAVSVAPSHGNSQATRLLVAESPDVRAHLETALSEGNRNWAPAAPVLAAVASLPDHDTTHAGSDGVVRELWPFHAGIAVGNLLAQATSLGLVAHPMAGFDEPAVRAAFEAPAALRILAIVAIGYPGEPDQLPDDLRARETATQRRLPLDVLVATDRWTAANTTTMNQYRERLERDR